MRRPLDACLSAPASWAGVEAERAGRAVLPAAPARPLPGAVDGVGLAGVTWTADGAEDGDEAEPVEPGRVTGAGRAALGCGVGCGCGWGAGCGAGGEGDELDPEGEPDGWGDCCGGVGRGTDTGGAGGREGSVIAASAAPAASISAMTQARGAPGIRHARRTGRILLRLSALPFDFQRSVMRSHAHPWPSTS